MPRPAVCGRHWWLAGLALIVGLLPAAGAAEAWCALSETIGAHIALEPRQSWALPGQTVTIRVVVEAEEQPLQGVDAYLNFDPTCLAVVDAQGAAATAVEPGQTLPVILQNRADNLLGRINYSAGITLGTLPITGTFTLATVHLKCLTPIPSAGTPIAFAFDVPHHRLTEIGYNGSPVLRSHADGAVYPRAQGLWLPVVLKQSPHG